MPDTSVERAREAWERWERGGELTLAGYQLADRLIAAERTARETAEAALVKAEEERRELKLLLAMALRYVDVERIKNGSPANYGRVLALVRHYLRERTPADLRRHATGKGAR